MDCPKCGGEMVKRNGKNGSFWGCRSYPKCNGTRSADEEQPPKGERLWSSYQKAIFEFVESGSGNGVVNAVAGSGKTSTNRECLNHTNKDSLVALVAFNKLIADEQRRGAPPHVKATTLHSLGLSSILSVFPGAKVEQKKVSFIFDKFTEGSEDRYAECKTPVLQLVSHLKNQLLLPDASTLSDLCGRFSIVLPSELEEEAYRLTARIFMESNRITNMIDFDDMIKMCCDVVRPEQFNLVVADEAQDFNPAQIEMVLRMLLPGGRIIATGDRFQSIYAFRGADSNAIDRIITATQAQTFPLSITYRCPKSVVEYVNKEFPEISFQSAPTAQEGKISHIGMDDFIKIVKPGDLVICRCNAPLVKPAFRLIRNGVKAIILGREIGSGLISLIEKIEKRFKPSGLAGLLSSLCNYITHEAAKLMESDRGAQAEVLIDQMETVVAISDSVQTIPELKSRVEQIFSDQKSGIVFASIHKTKGGEANNVFILRPDLLPHPMSKTAEAKQQERNLKYVAVTRAKENLFFVGE